VAAAANGVLLELRGAIARVAVAELVLPPKSDMVHSNSEVSPELLGAGLNLSLTSCATFNVSPSLTAVTPSANRMVPFAGSAVTFAVNCAEV
jgi:hypothetical protein